MRSAVPAVIKIDVSVWAQQPCATCTATGSNDLPAGLIRNGARDTPQAPLMAGSDKLRCSRDFGVAVSDGLQVRHC